MFGSEMALSEEDAPEFTESLMEASDTVTLELTQRYGNDDDFRKLEIPDLLSESDIIRESNNDTNFYASISPDCQFFSNLKVQKIRDFKVLS